MSEALTLLAAWVQRQASADGRAWFEAALASGGAVGLTGRKLGRAPLALDAADLEAAERARPGWRPAGLGLANAARLVLLTTSHDAGPALASTLSALCRTADLRETVDYFRLLPILPGPAHLVAFAREGVRSAIGPVFDAVALHNPFPAEQFDEDAWNQMVLKCLFIGSRLGAIQGLDARANPLLAATLVDYAQERWSANRPVCPELWRCVGPWARDHAAALHRAADSPDPTERTAARAALTMPKAL